MLKPYNKIEWGISLPEYYMLCIALDQGLVTEAQMEKDQFLFALGRYTALKYLNERSSKKFVSPIRPVRHYISQKEFCDICSEVVSQFEKISQYSCEAAVLCIRYPSNRYKEPNGARIDFNDNGLITGRVISNNGDRNLAREVEERVQNKIMSALYEPVK